MICSETGHCADVDKQTHKLSHVFGDIWKESTPLSRLMCLMLEEGVFLWSEGVCVCLLWWVCFLWCLFMWRRNECVSLEGVVFMACLCLDGTLRFLLCVCVLDLDGYWQHAESWHTAILSSTHSPVWPFKCILTLCWRCPMRLRMTAHTQIQTKTDADTHTAQMVWSQTETLGWSDRA